MATREEVKQPLTFGETRYWEWITGSPVWWIIIIIATVIIGVIFSVPMGIFISIVMPIYLVGSGVAFIKSVRKKQTKSRRLIINTLKSWYYVV